MDTDHDVIVVGGAFSGAATALLLRRRLPRCRILLIERQEQFDRKVGEATVEVSGYFLHRVLGLYDHLSREQLPKHGLRYWLSHDPRDRLGDMSEVGPSLPPGLPSFQLDRARLDEHLLAQAVAEGCRLIRPGRVRSLEGDWPGWTLTLETPQGERRLTTRWLVDASGRQAFLARRLGLQQPVEEHPTAAYWGRWSGVADLDGRRLMTAAGLQPVACSRRLATNHFVGYGWWCWVIPLAGGQTSIGVVYDKTLFRLPGEGHPRDRYRQFLTQAPGLRDLLTEASLEDTDFHALGHLPYRSRAYAGPGWTLVGDAAGFIDPYYSPGLDHASYTVYASARLIGDDLAGELTPTALEERLAEHNRRFTRSYDRWFKAIYQDKYRLMGDMDLVRCAFLVDTALYHLGIVNPVYRNPEALLVPTFGLDIPQARFAYALMRLFNRRMARLAETRRARGRYGRGRGRALNASFGPGLTNWKQLLRGLGLWLRLEVESRLPGPGRTRADATAVDQP